MKTSEWSKRKEVSLLDIKDKKKTSKVNLLGEMAEKEVPPVNTVVCVKNVATDIFREKISFNSTKQTCIEVRDDNYI